MTDLSVVAPAFVAMAHRIVWASVATVDGDGRPRSRILHPIWEWDGDTLVGWIGTGPTPLKRRHLDAHPFVSVSYWAPDHDTCAADCGAALVYDPGVRTRVWDLFKHAPAPVGYDPAIVPVWNAPTDDTFAVIRLDPHRLRVMPGTVLLQATGEVLTWST